MNSNIMFLNDAEPNNNATMWIFVALLVVLVVVLLVVPMFTNKKRAKQTMELHNSLQPGDRIKTVGGIIGTIKEINNVSPTEREMVIETGTGDNKTTMVFDIQALYQIIDRAASPAVSSETESVENNEAETETLLAKNDDVKVVENEVKDEPIPQAEEVAVKDEAEKVAEETVAAETKADEPAAEVKEEKTAAPKTTAAKKAATPAKKKPVNSAKNSTKK